MSPSSRYFNSSDALQVDRHIWKACVGTASDIVHPPPVQSIVYYFAQGHAEHADSTPVTFSNRVYSTPIVHCRVVSVQYLARADTDEVFAKIRLKPIASDDEDEDDRAMELEEDEEDEEKVRWYAKVLTSSDANNGGGFTVPKLCSNLFPKLDFQADDPVQKLSMQDLQGKVWKFRHVYKGKPVRHLFTTGWTKFVNSKKLIHGDSVVFIRDTRNQKLFITVRRGITHAYDNNYPAWMPSEPMEEVKEFGTSFSRRALGKVTKEEVIEAAELAAAGEEFEIVYYPGAGFSNFVVNAELVERMVMFPWSLNVKVKMSFKTEDQSVRRGMVRGTVVALSGHDKSRLWDLRSPWRLLKIKWEDPPVPGAAKFDEWVSPWEVEIENPLLKAVQMTPENMSSITAAPPRFNLNTRNGIVIRDYVPGAIIPSLGITPVHFEAIKTPEDGSTAQNDSINRGPATGSIKLFGKIISYNMSG